MATNRVYELAVRATLNGQQVVNTYHFQDVHGATNGQAECLALANAVKEVNRGDQNPALVYTNWTMRQVDGAGVTYDQTTFTMSGGAVFEGAFTGTLAGGGSGAPSAQQLAMVVSIGDGFAGRSHRNRIYLGGFNSVDVGSDGQWSSARTTAAQTHYDTFRGTYGSGGTSPDWSWVRWSHQLTSGWKRNPAPPPTYVVVGPVANGTEYNSVTSATAHRIIYTHRSRVIGVGS